MKTIDKQGNSINDLIAEVKREYRLKEWELQYEIVSQPSSGLFGLFGKKPAILRFHIHSPEERIMLFVQNLLKLLGVSYDKLTVKTEQKTVYLTLQKVADPGFVIGKNGQMLEQLQYLVNRVFENLPGVERVYLDTEDYRQRQEQAFLRNIIPLVNEVKATGKAITLDIMPSGDRRIIHKYVEKDKAVKTLTVGDGERKRIVLMPAAMNEKEALKAARANGNANTNGTAPAKPSRPDNRPPRSDGRPHRNDGRPPRTEPRAPRTDNRPPRPEAKPVKTEPKPETRAPKPELTPEQKAAESLNRHNQAHAHAHITAPKTGSAPSRSRRPYRRPPKKEETEK